MLAVGLLVNILALVPDDVAHYFVTDAQFVFHRILDVVAQALERQPRARWTEDAIDDLTHATTEFPAVRAAGGLSQAWEDVCVALRCLSFHVAKKTQLDQPWMD